MPPIGDNTRTSFPVTFLQAGTVILSPGMKTKSEAEPGIAVLLQIANFPYEKAKINAKKLQNLFTGFEANNDTFRKAKLFTSAYS